MMIDLKPEENVFFKLTIMPFGQIASTLIYQNNVEKENYFNLFFLTCTHIFSNDDVYISVYVDDKIITNIDIKKENEYLKTIN